MQSVPCPFDANSSCRQARDAYLRENGWSLDAYDAPLTEASVFGIKFSVPNTPTRRGSPAIARVLLAQLGLLELAGRGARDRADEVERVG